VFRFGFLASAGQAAQERISLCVVARNGNETGWLFGGPTRQSTTDVVSPRAEWYAALHTGCTAPRRSRKYRTGRPPACPRLARALYTRPFPQSRPDGQRRVGRDVTAQLRETEIQQLRTALRRFQNFQARGRGAGSPGCAPLRAPRQFAGPAGWPRRPAAACIMAARRRTPSPGSPARRRRSGTPAGDSAPQWRADSRSTEWFPFGLEAARDFNSLTPYVATLVRLLCRRQPLASTKRF
jgi:hypothetical protein